MVEPVGKHIVLAGVLCAGKSKVGKTLAKLTGRSHIDSDEVLIRRLSLPPRRLIERLTRAQFQIHESEVISDLASSEPAVISLGSGSIGHENVELRSENIEKLRARAMLFNLEADVETLYSRYLREKHKNDLRRHVEDMRTSLWRRLEARTGIHRATCDFTIRTTHLKIDEVAKTVLDLIQAEASRECQRQFIPSFGNCMST